MNGKVAIGLSVIIAILLVGEVIDSFLFQSLSARVQELENSCQCK